MGRPLSLASKFKPRLAKKGTISRTPSGSNRTLYLSVVSCQLEDNGACPSTIVYNIQVEEIVISLVDDKYTLYSITMNRPFWPRSVGVSVPLFEYGMNTDAEHLLIYKITNH